MYWILKIKNHNLFSELSEGSEETQRERAELASWSGDSNEGNTEATRTAERLQPQRRAISTVNGSLTAE